VTLSAPLEVEFDYTRSLGPVLSRFMTGLRHRTILGARLADGRVACPPPEFDPGSHQAPTELVEVGPEGVVQTWTWVAHPVKDQPLDRPFAFAMVQLDGADTPMLHAVDVGDAGPDAVSTGMRVTARWADERAGNIRDIKSFEVVASGDNGGSDTLRSSQGPGHTPLHEELGTDGATTGIITPVNLEYTYAASAEESRFYRGLAEGKLRGQRCPTCGKVYVPPRSACPVDGSPTTEEVELPDRGIVTTFCIVNVPFLGQRIEPPYVSAYVLLEGADIAFLHLILGCDPSEVRMGMRVEAVWRPREEWGTTIENIDHFKPTGEEDAPYESYAQHL
jgi:uncharacterized OB-fold protein